MPLATQQGGGISAWQPTVTPHLELEKQFSSKGVDFMWELPSYNLGGNVQDRPKITHVHTLSVLVQVLWEADTKMEINVQEIYGGNSCEVKGEKEQE